MGRPKSVDTLTVRRFVNKNRSLIYGMLLGDSSIINRGSHAMLRVYHAEDQKALVMYKYELLKEVAPTPPKVYQCKWGQPKWYFYTAADTEWQKVWSTFHQDSIPKVVNGKKVFYKRVTQRILDALDDQGLAFWIMDDGSYTGRQAHNASLPMWKFTLHTEGYSREENDLIAGWFRKRYGISATAMQSKKKLKDGTDVNYWFIRIGWREFDKIVPCVEKYIHPSMVHKIGFSRDKEQLAHLTAS